MVELAIRVTAAALTIYRNDHQRNRYENEKCSNLKPFSDSSILSQSQGRSDCPLAADDTLNSKFSDVISGLQTWSEVSRCCLGWKVCCLVF